MTTTETAHGLRLAADLLEGMGPSFPDTYVTARGHFITVQVSDTGAGDDTREAAVDALLAVTGGEASLWEPREGREDEGGTWGGYGHLGDYEINVYAPHIGATAAVPA